VSTFQPLGTPEVDVQAEALFKEARRRRRHRRVGAAFIVAVLVGAGTGTGVELTGGNGFPSTPTSASAFLGTVISSTRAARTAQMSFVVKAKNDIGVPHGSDTSVARGSGSVNFVRHEAAYVTVATYTRFNPVRVSTVRSPRTIVAAGTQFTSGLGDNKGFTAQAKAKLGTLLTKRWFSGPITDGATGATSPLGPNLVSAYVFDLLRAIKGSVQEIGQTNIHGVPVTEYQTRTTLAELDAASKRNFGEPSVPQYGSLVPSATRITIPIRFWIDSQRHLVQVQTTQLMYSATYADHSGMGAAQVPSRSYSNAKLISLHSSGSSTLTMAFFDLGHGASIKKTPVSEVATSAQVNKALSS